MTFAAQVVARSEQPSHATPGWTLRAAARDWSDAELRERVLDREEAGWSELVRRFRALIYRCITKVTRKHAPDMAASDIDEIFAEVLLALFRDDARKIRLYDASRGAKLGSWIGLISMNMARDYLRGLGRRPMLDRIDGAPDRCDELERTPLDMLMEKERWEHFNGMLTDFSDKDRTFLDLYYGQGLDAARVADEMTISIKTVYSKKHKIRHSLRRSVELVGDECAIADLAA
ncbi:MAG: hypothetical protein Tsb0020_12820 [Haliangiales bacterium]